VISALLLATIAGQAAADWLPVLDHEEYIAYVDPSTIERNGSMAQMWDVTDLKYPQPSPRGYAYASSLAHMEFDCENVRTRTLYFSLRSGQMGEGREVDSFWDATQWLPVAPETLLNTLLEFACAEK
jgi:hypothetical protein